MPGWRERRAAAESRQDEGRRRRNARATTRLTIFCLKDNDGRPSRRPTPKSISPTRRPANIGRDEPTPPCSSFIGILGPAVIFSADRVNFRQRRRDAALPTMCSNGRRSRSELTDKENFRQRFEEANPTLRDFSAHRVNCQKLRRAAASPTMSITPFMLQLPPADRLRAPLRIEPCG